MFEIDSLLAKKWVRTFKGHSERKKRNLNSVSFKLWSERLMMDEFSEKILRTYTERSKSTSGKKRCNFLIMRRSEKWAEQTSLFTTKLEIYWVVGTHKKRSVYSNLATPMYVFSCHIIIFRLTSQDSRVWIRILKVQLQNFKTGKN